MNDLSKKFSKGTIVIHWLSAILILSLFPLGKYMSGLESTDKMGLMKLHAGLGITVLVLTLIRVYFLFKHERPEDLKTGSKLNDKLAVWIHHAFYVLLIGICFSGVGTLIIGGYGNAFSANAPVLIKKASEVVPLKAHGLMSVIFMLLLVMHVLGVVKHFVLKKENTLKRIS